ncbi:HET-domain-containing protein [Nemania diffusa]|nr:HET-domain-containing protein [Nemania diffusa]
MAPNGLDDPSTVQWLETRRKASLSLREATVLGESQRWREERTAFPLYTSSSPHSCEHCRDTTIDLTDSSKETRVRLPYTFTESVLAARGGCALYQVFLDLTFDGIHRKARTAWPKDRSISFWIRYYPETLPWDTARLQFSILASSDDADAESVLGGEHFSVWALEGNAAAVPISSRPYELDFKSSASTAWGRNCIRDCQLNHSECSGPLDDSELGEIINPASIPSRLLKLYQNENGILHAQVIGRSMQHDIPTPEVSRRGFAVLSYCWGGPQPIQLTCETRGMLAEGYPITILPKTLADAAWFTHQLGLEYLWVDALCIFQDDPDDKGREIPRMGQYYGDATVTLCAASAIASSSGFQATPPPAEDPANYLFGPVELRVKTATGELGTLQVLKEADYLNSHREREPIVRRGWTLQESLLSRRMLIFSSLHLYFSCKEANASCGGREPLPKPRTIGMYQSRVDGVSTISGLQRMYPVVKTWDRVVNEYTQRLLGFPGDKLLAISAMAASLVRMARDERALVSRYCAGLLLDVEGKDWGWEGELLWAVTQPATPLGTTGLTFTPSWSWASVEAPVHRWEAIVSNLPEDGIRLLDIHAQLADERNPFGAVQGGLLRLMARTRPFSTVDKAEFNLVVTRNRNLGDETYDRPTRSALVVCPDTAEAEDRYQRVGIFEFQIRNVSSSDVQLSALKQALTLFDNRQPRELFIV